MIRQVECVGDPDLDKVFPKEWCATVEIFAKKGQKHFIKVEYCKGDPENPLSWEEMIEKFNHLSGRFLTKERRSKIVEQARRLEKICDLQKWSTFLLRNR